MNRYPAQNILSAPIKIKVNGAAYRLPRYYYRYDDNKERLSGNDKMNGITTITSAARYPPLRLGL